MNISSSTIACRSIERLPSVFALYGKALLRQWRRPHDGAPPALGLTCSGIRPDTHDMQRYIDVCGFAPEHGIPPTYPHVLAFALHMQLMCDRRFPYPLLGLVHLANAIRQHGPLQSSSVWRIDATLTQCRRHNKGQVFVLHTAVHDTGSSSTQPCWESDSYYLRTGVRAPVGEPYTGVIDDFAAVDHCENWQVGANLGRRYARVSGDVNPIHLSALSARLFGFPHAIAHGMWSHARALATLLPRSHTRALQTYVEFKTPLLLPAQAGLWTEVRGSRRFFELRDAQGIKPHLRGILDLT